MLINWTDPAVDDLDRLYEFIARDAPAYASSFVEQIINVVTRLEDFPYSGRRVPEADRDDVREVIYQGYRILYWLVDEQRLDIIAVVHGSRDLGNPLNQSWDMG